MIMQAKVKDTFSDDDQKLKDAIAAYAADEAEEKQAEATYKQVILKKLDSLKTADEIMVYLQLYVFQSEDPNSDASMLGIFGDQVGLKGKALEVNSYLTAVHNDVQKIVDTNTSTSSVDSIDVVAGHLDDILKDLKSLPTDGTGPVDKTTIGNLTDADTAMRKEFYITNGPTPDPKPTPGSYYFTDGTPPGPGTAPSIINNFQQMRDLMKQTGDPAHATEAYQGLSTNFNAAKSTTQTANSGLNEQVNQLTNYIKQLLGFYQQALLEPSMKLINVAITNGKPQ